MVLFDQSITGLHNSVFKLTVNETRLCPLGTHISGGIILFGSIVIWLILSCMQCKEYYPNDSEEEEGKSDRWCFIGTMILIFFFYVIYIFTDTPWPWSCFDGDPIMKKTGIIVQLSFLCLLLVMILILVFIYIFTICRALVKK